MMHPTLIVPRPPRRFLDGHPWLYSNEITMDAAAKALPAGTLVKLTDSHARVLGYAHFNPHSLIAVRALVRGGEVLGDDFYFKRLQNALALREKLFDVPFYRLSHGEADGLPGLVIDRFDDVLVIQANSAGMHLARVEIAEALKKLLKPSGIFLRGDAPARALEGLPQENEILHGEIPDRINVLQNGLTYFADSKSGQKTGWYFDQRRNHALLAEMAKGKSVLDLYAHSGGFGLLAAKHGASKVVCVDSSKPALQLAKEAAKENALSNVEFVESDVFEFLEAHQEKYDCVVGDPPPFARSKKDVGPASRGYRKLAKLCAKRAAPGGVLFLFSCSHAITRERFDEECLKGVAEASRTARILARTGADMDHPLHPYLPESAYLKGLLLAID